MAVPLFVLLGMAAAGATGLAKGAKGVADSSKANRIQEEAERLLRKAEREVGSIREETNGAIQELGRIKAETYATELKDFVACFSQIKHINLKESIGQEEMVHLTENLAEMKNTVLSAVQVLSSGVAGIGAGALLGWGAYGGVMALGTASTGAAISGLSGIAATNATLAWLGGGALAAGGGGMALGTAVLGGIVAGPALLIAGGIFGSKAKEKLNNAYSNLSEAERISEELKTAGVELQTICKKTEQIQRLLKQLASLQQQANRKLDEIVNQRGKRNWKLFSGQEKKTTAACLKLAQMIKVIIDTPLLTEDGILTKEIKEVLGNKEETIKQAELTVRELTV